MPCTEIDKVFYVCYHRHMPAWRNWQTHWTQNPASFGRAGSTPAAGIFNT